VQFFSTNGLESFGNWNGEQVESAGDKQDKQD
jgi:hypothetical protein